MRRSAWAATAPEEGDPGTLVDPHLLVMPLSQEPDPADGTGLVIVR